MQTMFGYHSLALGSIVAILLGWNAAFCVGAGFALKRLNFQNR